LPYEDDACTADNTNVFFGFLGGNFYQGLDLLLLFEEPLKEYVGIVQNIKVHMETLLRFKCRLQSCPKLFFRYTCLHLMLTRKDSVAQKFLFIFISDKCCLKLMIFSGLRWQWQIELRHFENSKSFWRRTP